MTASHIDSVEVSVADSWVVPSNKTGTGNGEAKIYVGQRTSKAYWDFFGPPGFRLICRFRKSDLLRFLDEMKDEYWFPSLPYRDSQHLRERWIERRRLIESFSDEYIVFSVEEQSQLDGPRAYINSEDENYQILRLLPLPGTSILKIVKLQEAKETIFEFRLMPNFDGFAHRFVESDDAQLTPQDAFFDAGSGRLLGVTTSERTIMARVGQQKFKKDVLKQCDGVCAFTLVRDESLLIAGHIKPWAKANDNERLDPQNGLVFTPTYDRLFDNGLISFTERGLLIISPLLSRETATRLHIAPNMEVEIPLGGPSNKRRREYMEFHREHQFRS